MQIIPSSLKIGVFLHLHIHHQVAPWATVLPGLSHPLEVNAAAIVHSGWDLQANDFLLGRPALPRTGAAELNEDPPPPMAAGGEAPERGPGGQA